MDVGSVHCGGPEPFDTGIRGILARVVIFHWNRIGLQVEQQSLLAAANRDAVLGDAE